MSQLRISSRTVSGTRAVDTLSPRLGAPVVLSLAGLLATAAGCAGEAGGVSSTDGGHADARLAADVGMLDVGATDAATRDAELDAPSPIPDTGATDAGEPDACVAGASCSTGDPCTTGVTACASGSTVCVESAASPAGTACPGGTCDGAGACVICTPGSSCAPSEPCREGSTVCTAGVASCVPGALLPAGAACPGGTCDATGHCGCVSGSACAPSDECRTGTSACGPDGAVICNATGNQPAGTACTGGVCDGSGTCVSCAAGAACVPSGGCDTGRVDCTSGAETCVPVAHLPPGTSCGPSSVCDGSGTCVPCTAGASCSTGNECTTGTTDCSTGHAVCTTTGSVAAGVACAGGVCSGTGTCVPCVSGMACPTGDVCTTGSLVCSTGTPMCAVTGSAPAGTACPGGVCSGGGTCVACAAGSGCSTGNPCTTGAIQCASGAPVCALAANVPAGTPCPGGVCNGTGTCLASCAGTPWGTVPSGYANTAYASSSPSGPCMAETRTCTNGTMSGSYTATSCTPGCTGTPWGNVPSGYSNTAYASSSPAGPCHGETRTCTSGSLSGSYPEASCTPGPNPACRITLNAGGLGGGGPPGGPWSLSLGWGVSIDNTYGLSSCGLTVAPTESGLSAYSGPSYSAAAGGTRGEGPFKNVSTSSLPYSVGISASSVVCPAGTSQVPGPTSASCSMTLQASGTQVNPCSSSVTIDCR